MERHEPEQCGVGVEAALSIIVGKWKPVILMHLMVDGTKRFSELKQAMPGITQKMLTAQLRELEQQRIIRRVVYAEVPPRVEYSMTAYGEGLRDILQAMHTWGTAHLAYMQAQEEAEGAATPEPVGGR